MNSKVMFSSKSVQWETPQGFFDKLNEEFHFTVDVCALPENAKCERYFTPQIDGLKQSWDGVAWCNPPYGREIGDWVAKAAETAMSGGTVVMLLPARTDTRWFHEHIYKKREIRFIKGRLKFGDGKNSAPFPSMVVVFGEKRKEICLATGQECFRCCPCGENRKEQASQAWNDYQHFKDWGHLHRVRPRCAKRKDDH